MRAPDWTPHDSAQPGVCFEASVPKDHRDRTRVTIHQRTDRRYQTDGIIETAAPTARSFDAPLPAGPIPSYGEAYETCGETFPAVYCPEQGCGKIHHYGRTCRRASCPRCWRAWAIDRTKAKLRNISVYARRRAGSNRHVLRHHITVSFARLAVRFNSKDPLDQGFRVVRRLMQLIDVEAGYAVYHPWRIKQAHRGEVLGHSSGLGSMGWADILSLLSDGAEWDDVRSKYLIYAPHFHVTGISPYAMTEDRTNPIEERTGVVTHRITGPDGKSIGEGEEPTASVLAYNFSHAGLIEDGNGRTRLPIRAFGPIEDAGDPTDKVEAEVTAAVRSISQQVLGISLPSGTCSAPDTSGVLTNPSPGTIGWQLAHAEAADPGTGNQQPDECGADLVRCTLGRINRHLADPEWRSSLPPHRLEELKKVRNDPPTRSPDGVDSLIDLATADD